MKRLGGSPSGALIVGMMYSKGWENRIKTIRKMWKHKKFKYLCSRCPFRIETPKEWPFVHCPRHKQLDVEFDVEEKHDEALVSHHSGL